jgi:DNA invertase Pin-like site-specific DNA recombinase
MTDSEILPPAILQRKAVVYVRQSTQTQLEVNTEGRRRQYELVDVARENGGEKVGHGSGGMIPRRAA